MSRGSRGTKESSSVRLRTNGRLGSGVDDELRGRSVRLRRTMETPMSLGSSAKLLQLEVRLESNWKAIRAAREATQQRRAELTAAFASHGSPDTSLVVFGSVAREEV